MKKCPYCAEQIQDEAIVCRFCNRDQAAPQKTSSKPPIARTPEEEAAARRSNRLYLFGSLGSVAALAILAVVGGAVTADRQAQTAPRRSPTVARDPNFQKRAELVQQLKDDGTLKRHDCALRTAQVDSVKWHLIDADSKEALTKLTAAYCADQTGSGAPPLITILDSHTGREVASVGVFGYSVK